MYQDVVIAKVAQTLMLMCEPLEQGLGHGWNCPIVLVETQHAASLPWSWTLRFWQIFDCRQHFFRVALGLDLGKDLCHSTLLVNQKRRAFDADCRPVVHVFFFEYSEGF